MQQIAIHALLWTGIVLEVACCVGVLVMRNALDRLHYAGAATTIPPLLVALAVVVDEEIAIREVSALVVAAALLFLNPPLTSATARAIRLREQRR